MTFLRLFRFFCRASCVAVFAIVAVTCLPPTAKAQDTAAVPAPSLEQVLGMPAGNQTADAAPPPVAVPSSVQPATPVAETAPPPSPPDAAGVGDLLKKIESAPPARDDMPPMPTPQITQQEPLTPAPQEVDASKAPQPPAGALASPNPQNISGVPTQLPGPAGENLFFDSEALGGPGSQQHAGKVSNVSPALEPAASMIAVTKEYDQNSEQAQLVAAQRAVQLRRYDAALRIYNQLYEKNNRDPNILLGRAVALQHMGQEDEAIHTYEDLLQLKPDNIEAQINMLGLIGEHYPAVALQRLHELSSTYPNDVRVLAQTAVMEARSGNYSEALGSLGMAASLDQTNANHVYNMAVIADRAGRKEEAVQYYEKALEIDTVYGAGRTIPRDSVYDRLAQLR